MFLTRDMSVSEYASTTPQDIFKEALRQFPAVFVGTTPAVASC